MTIKIRVEGKENEIFKLIESIDNSDTMTVESFSKLYKNDNSKYLRCYMSVEIDED